jgi:hypothetical protein
VLLVYPKSNPFQSIQLPSVASRQTKSSLSYKTFPEIHNGSNQVLHTLCSDIRAIRARIPRRIRVDVTGILDLAHAGSTTTDSATEVGTAAAAVHHVDDEGSNECGEAEPEEGAGSLSLTAVLLGVCGAVADAVGGGVALVHVRITLLILEVRSVPCSNSCAHRGMQRAQRQRRS